ncbi:52 kDa repressor of the inhibitor of the protein kinase-like [Metopolophium dirhodum]|uniref:52 kDa repressor of the inhibitor of the protein kinase-like n=1 Tax=Metopolophium dirhodum TaxID=44670 RepID=UPI00298F929F|nr:52 kDa repressor of the inhibitor of the protein kinase-like [Metopolophium dirhodum]
MCTFCVLFARDFGGKGNHQQLGILVNKPFNNWKKAIETLSHHSTTQFHKNSVIFELALRGRNDSGPLDLNEPDHNDGNFRALLRMRISCGDKQLINHIENQSLNAMYISPSIQNNFIKICGKIIQDNLVCKINAAKSFSVLVDESTDISRIEQLTLCIRYIDSVETTDTINYVLREDFLQFVPVHSTTGQNLASVIINSLQALGINDKYMVGQGYDGAASMSGNLKGVQTIIRESHPAALYVHCSAHSLNLALAHSCNVQYVRNCIGTIKSIGNFIKSSAMRTNILKTKIKNILPNTKWTKLTSMCDTRWVENHNGIQRFVEIFQPIVETLEELQLVQDINTSSKSIQFYRAIVTSEFILSMVTSNTLFSMTLPLCKSLQSVSCDLVEAVQHIETILNELTHLRENIDHTFNDIFEQSELLLKSIDGEENIRIPRIVARQQNRVNIVTNCPKTYFRIAIAIPFFDDFIRQLKERFTNHKKIISSLCFLLPNKCTNSELEASDFELYSEFLDLDALSNELRLWKRKWCDKPILERSPEILEAYSNCNKNFFPNISFLLKVLATLPVTTATPERTFSTLKRIKNYLRNATGEDRLTGLALLSVHRNIVVDPEEITIADCIDLIF